MQHRDFREWSEFVSESDWNENVPVSDKISDKILNLKMENMAELRPVGAVSLFRWVEEYSSYSRNYIFDDYHIPILVCQLTVIAKELVDMLNTKQFDVSRLAA